jgi:hypothetical protein
MQYLYDVAASWTIHMSWWCLFGEINYMNISKNALKFLWQQSLPLNLQKERML